VTLQGVVAIAVVAMVSGVGVSIASRGYHDDWLRAFEHAIDRYSTRRRTIDASVPAFALSADVERIRAATEARADALRRARAGAREGDVFSPAVGIALRRRIAGAIAAGGIDPKALLADMREEGEEWERPSVNGRFSWTTAAAMPPSIIAALPHLPESLQYRFVGVDLALVDVDARLIVDVLPDALPNRAAVP